MTTKFFINPPVDMEALPAPPVAANLDLSHFDCMSLDLKRLFNSELMEETTGDEFKAAVCLWGKAWHQVPASSLPNDDKKLALLAGYKGNPNGWAKVREGATRGVTLCSDGRLYHFVVAEQATAAEKKSRAGKRGAHRRWSKANPLESNNTGHATAYGKEHGTSDDTLYSNGDGKPHGKHDAEKGREYSSPLPPSLATPGSGSLEAPPARPTAQTRSPPKDPEIDVGDGVIYAISSAGNCDLVSAPIDAVLPDFTKAQALELRNRALHPKPPDGP